MPRIVTISAGASDVAVSPSTIPDDGLTVAVVTATLSVDGAPYANAETNGRVTCAVSGTGNTVTAQSTVTDGQGRLFWNVVSTGAATKTVTVTAFGPTDVNGETTATLTCDYPTGVGEAVEVAIQLPDGRLSVTCTVT